MPRRRVVAKREVLPDPLFNSQLVTKFVNVVMRDGKKAVAEGIVYKAFDMVAERAKDDPLKVWDRALSNVRPRVEVKSRRVGGSNYQVPVEVNTNRRTSLALRWLIGFARKRPERTMVQKLAAEIIDAANMRGGAIKKKEDTHKMAEANKAFAHYRW
jgi:small subunit ribosomal protein S7